MIKFLTSASAAFAITVALASPANAQLLRGGLGGGLGGGIGIGGGLPIEAGGDIGTTIGVPDAVDDTTRTVHSNTRTATRTAHSTTRATRPVNTADKADIVSIPAVNTPSPVVPAVKGPVVAVPTVQLRNALVMIPAIPNVTIRRTAIIDAGIAPVSYAEVPAYVDQEYVVLQDELRGSGVRVEKQGQQILLEMPSDVTFSFNKYNIQPRFYGVLDAVSHTLGKYPATYIDVNGHTDAIGSFGYNQVLSKKRAGSVADYLAARQVNPARMYVQGFGKTEPIASNATIIGRAANRRVEIILTPYAA